MLLTGYTEGKKGPEETFSYLLISFCECIVDKIVSEIIWEEKSLRATRKNRLELGSCGESC